MEWFALVLILISCCFLFTVKGQHNTDVQCGKRMVAAACQFSVSADIAENYNLIKDQIREAKQKKAGVVPFPECALSGFPEMDFNMLKRFNWDLLVEKTVRNPHAENRTRIIN